MTKPQSYRRGLRFACQRCGACCTGEPGSVWLDEQDRARLAAALGKTVEDFEGQYVRRRGPRQRLYEWPDGDCVFYERASRSCTVYEARPQQCRTWPWWPRNLESEQAWQQASRQCPGCGTGALLRAEAIEALLGRG